jgi:hypothetical protein
VPPIRCPLLISWLRYNEFACVTQDLSYGRDGQAVFGGDSVNVRAAQILLNDGGVAGIPTHGADLSHHERSSLSSAA